MSYRHVNNLIALVLLVFQGTLAAIATVSPETLGLSPRVVAWLAIGNVGVGIALNQLQPLRRQRDPEE